MATLLDVRTQFIKKSGRYDLVTDTTSYADNGADYYIQAGQKWLEKHVEFNGQTGKVFRKLATGKYALTFRDMRVIEQVYAADSTERGPLERIDYADLLELYPKAFPLETQGEPKYWCPICVRSVNMDNDDQREGIMDYMDVIENSDSYNAIVIMPPADSNYHIEIKGKFASKKLTADEDSNWWSANEEFVLMLSALRALEVTYRNTQGVNDWTNAIMSELFGIEKDHVEDNTYHINQLEG